MPPRRHSRRAPPRAPSPISLASTSTTTSSYFTPSSSFISRSSRRLPRVPEYDGDESGLGSASQPDFSIADSVRSLSRTSTSRLSSRPDTASGRKSRAASVLGHDDSQSIICAVSEARGVSPAVGVAFVNVSLGEVILSQICDNQSYVKTIHKIQMMGPSRILFMSTACPPHGSSTLFTLVQEHIPEAQLDAMDRSAWSEMAGMDYIKDLAFESDIEPIKVAIQGKYYATASFSAAMQYIEHKFTVGFVPNSLRIQYQPSEDTMMIDISALQSLEILQNIKNPKSKDCLFGLLNHTLTPMGTRMLRNNILQPSTRHDSFLSPRYDALQELASTEGMYIEIRKALKNIRDVEKTLTKVACMVPRIWLITDRSQIITVSAAADVFAVEGQINQILLIKSFVEAIPDLYQALLPAQAPLLAKARNLCDHEATSRILNNIQRVIEPDVTYMSSPLDLRNQRTFAVKAGMSGLLDVARQTYKELTEDIHEHVDAINEEFRVGAAIKFDNGRKYWLRIKVSNLDNDSVPDVFINVIRKKEFFECQTIDLIKLNRRLSDACDEVVIQSDAVVQKLIKELQHEVPCLFRVSESVALVDMIASFVQVTTLHDYVRPDITGTLALKAARHPILDKNDSSTFIPNDYYSAAHHCFHVVTGCNMSGKSTYIRAVALLQIMAQIGCFVPAEYAAFGIIQNIFARVSLDDRIESNLSTFSVEMRDMAFIFKNIDQNSMAIIDELGRGTSTRDGLSIALAMSEALVQTKASVWFATHFIELAKALENRPGVLNLHLSATNSTTAEGLPHITMLYKVTGGTIDDEEHYGINLARAIGLPKEFCDKAEEVANDLRRKREEKRQSSESRRMMAKRALILDLHGQLKLAYESGSEEALPAYLTKLQQQFVTEMERLALT